jgi:hypothetical protein
MKERSPRNNNKEGALEQRRIKKQTKEDVAKVCPTLEQDPDWPLVSGVRKNLSAWEDRQFGHARTRLTKKAVNLLLPEFKSLACSGSGTSRRWVHVNILIPEGARKPDNIEQRVKRMLMASGIEYSSYYTDHGPNNHYSPCLSVRVNDISWGHH